MNEELKPCPFCGGSDIDFNFVFAPEFTHYGFYYYCTKCRAAAYYAGTKRAARKKWNRRATNDS